MPSGRIFRFIGFNGTENGDKVCTLGPKKLIAAVRLAVRVISKKFKVKHPALRVPPGGNQVDGLPPAAIELGCAHPALRVTENIEMTKK